MISSICQFILKSAGWKLENTDGPIHSCIMIVYPHTSNWDFVLGILAKGALGVSCHWLGKKELFWWPASLIMKALGGIAVDRKNPEGLIEKLEYRFHSSDDFILVITPEGTRSYRPSWKNGFYRLALGTNSPLVMVSMDFPSKTIKLSEPLNLTGNSSNDLQIIQDFYQGVEGKSPELAAPIELAVPNNKK